MRDQRDTHKDRPLGTSQRSPPIADYVHRPTIDVRLLRHLWSFLAVAEARHFGRAAERLGISQPPLTQQIQILERSLGVRLFERSRRGATLTPQGLAILPAVQRFAEQMGRLEAVVRAAREGKSHFVTIGAITSTFYNVLPKILEALNTEYPHITASFIELHTAEAIQMLQTGVVDLAFARLAHGVDTIKVAPLVTDRLMVALPARHRLASAAEVDIAELNGESWIQVRRQLSPASFDAVITACAKGGFSPTIRHEVGSEASQIAFVSCGLGVALLPESQARQVAPNVLFRPLWQPVEIVTVALVWDEERISEPARTIVDIALRMKGQ